MMYIHRSLCRSFGAVASLLHSLSEIWVQCNWNKKLLAAAALEKWLKPYNALVFVPLGPVLEGRRRPVRWNGTSG